MPVTVIAAWPPDWLAALRPVPRLALVTPALTVPPAATVRLPLPALPTDRPLVLRSSRAVAPLTRTLPLAAARLPELPALPICRIWAVPGAWLDLTVPPVTCRAPMPPALAPIGLKVPPKVRVPPVTCSRPWPLAPICRPVAALMEPLFRTMLPKAPSWAPAVRLALVVNRPPLATVRVLWPPRLPMVAKPLSVTVPPLTSRLPLPPLPT